MKNYISLTIITIFLVFFSITNASALTKVITQSGNWSAPSTWGGTSPPISTDDVIINGGFTVTIDVSNAACQSLQLGGSVLNTGTGTLAFTALSQLTVSGIVNIGPVNNNGTAGSLTMTAGGTLVCDGIILGRLGTWTPGTGTIAFTGTNSIPNNTNISFNNLSINSGTTTLTRNLTVTGNILVLSGGTLDGGANILSLEGNWTNNGTFTGSTSTVTFIRNGNQTITGTGLNNFNLIRLNMGTSINNTLEVLASNFSAPDPFLTIVNGTFKISGTFTFTNTFFTGPAYTIDPTAGFWLNNPNVTVNAQAGGISNKGLLRLSTGTYNIGTGVDNSFAYYTGSSIIIDGGILNIAGQLTRNNSTQTTSYTQSGGIVTVVGQGSTDPTFAGFDLGAVGSTFTMSGGTIVIRNATSAPSDFLNASSVANVTGGVLQIGDANTLNAQVIRIQSLRPIGNLFISNTTSQATKPTAQLVTSGLNVVGNVTIQSGTTFNGNGLNLSLGGDWSNNGTFVPGGNTITFNGSGSQALTTPGGETLNNLTINKVSSTLTLNNSLTVNNTFSLALGTISIGNNTLTLNGIVTGAGTLTSGGSGTVSYNQGSAGQNILASGYGNLIFSNFSKTLAASGIIGIMGTFTPGTASGHTLTGSTIDFNGGSQPVPAFAFNNLTLSGSGIKSGSGTVTVAGTLTNNVGIDFSGVSILNLNGAVNSNNGTISAATLNVGTGAVFTNNGTITSSLDLNGPGTLVQGVTGSLNIGGVAGITGLNATAAGNTVTYTGTSQTLVPAIYHHLSLSGSGIPILAGVNTINGNFSFTGSVAPSASGDLAIGGNFTIGSGTSFDAGSFSHTLKGNWVNNGTFIEGISTFTLNGSSLQTMNGSSFFNLSVANAAGVTILADETVNGTLTLSGGVFSLGPHTLFMNGALATGSGSLLGGSSSTILIGGSGATTTLPNITLNALTLNRASGISLSGDVSISGALTILNGTLVTGTNSILLGPAGTISEPAGQPVVGNMTTTRTINATTGTVTFGNIGADILLNGVAPGSTTVLRKTGVASLGGGHSSINRYYEITPATNTGLNAGFVFHYDVSEVNGQNPDIFELYRSNDNGLTWNNIGGIVNPALLTVSVAGVNDFSRWTASDTNNRIGNTISPSTSNISPAAVTVGNPAFTLIVNGTNFINGKSTVRLNGLNRTTTFVSSTQLTALIPTGDLLVSGAFPVTVFSSGGGGESNAQTLAVNPAQPVKVNVETAANGTGSIVASQSLVSGSSITVYAVARDASDNFVANISATAWTLENISGGVVGGDLVPAVDGKSAVFTGHIVGSTKIAATSGILVATPSGAITVTPGISAKISAETLANGTGVVVPSQTLASGSSMIVYAITRDASNNFIANVSPATWILENLSGGVVQGDMVIAPDGKSAAFTAHLVGSADIRVTSGVLAQTATGIITVTPGTPVKIRVETAANGSGTVVPAQILVSGSSITIYAITRDALNNFVANISPTSWILENISGGVVAGDLVVAPGGKSAVFTGHAIGTVDIKSTFGALVPTATGILTITAGSATKVRAETAANGSGTVVPAQSVASGSSISIFAITRDASNNFVANISPTSWILENISGGIVAGDVVVAPGGKSATFTGHVTGALDIKVTSGALVPTATGIITVTPGAAAKVRAETAANGSGTVVPAQSLASGSSISIFAITRDASNNFVANISPASWILENISGGVVAGDLVAAVNNKSAIFTGHLTGIADIKATFGVLPAFPSGFITVTPGAAATIAVETSANGTGTVVQAQLLSSGNTLSAYAITRDASGNYTANIAPTSWILENITGNIQAGDLVSAPDGKSAIFSAHASGSADIRATLGVLATTPSGTITVGIPAIQVTQNEFIGTGQSSCYNATQTINVAGGGTTFVVDNGGSVTMIAGQNIIYLPGTTVNAGGYMHGYITPNNQFCYPAPIPAIPVLTGEAETQLNSAQSLFTTYPNPTSGEFSLEIKGEIENTPIKVQIYGMHGENILNTELPGTGKYSLSLAEQPAGIYIIRVSAGGKTEMAKIIRL